MSCTWLAENTERKNGAKNRHLGTIAQLCRAISSQLRHVSTIGKKLVKQQYLLHMTLQYGELRHTSDWDRFVSLGRPSKFRRGFTSWLRYCSDVAQRKPTKLCTMFGRLLRGYTIYMFGGCCPVTEFCQVQNSVSVLQVLRSPIGSVTARHSSSGREPNFAALSTGRHLYSAGRPSRWALAHILVHIVACCIYACCIYLYFLSLPYGE